MKKYLPGHPNLIVLLHAGRRRHQGGNYIYGIGPQDGTVLGLHHPRLPARPAARIPQAQFDPTKFNWIGSPSRTVSMGMVWNASTDVRTIQDAMHKEVMVGATSIAQDTGIFPRALNRSPAPSSRSSPAMPALGAVDLAIERGEVQGKIGSTWKSLNSGPTADWVSDKKVTVLVQLGVKKAPRHSRLIFRSALDLAKSPEDRQVLEVLCAPSATGYPSFMGPGVPKERVEAIRNAYLQSLKDPEIIEAIQRAGTRSRSDQRGRAQRRRARTSTRCRKRRWTVRASSCPACEGAA